ncbi:ABC transporter permease [Clostridium bowmanii]|uniref:ABC transporter permease n=1 Tax=Clostridium bowmanii TaxID=132925 RepID=UPI001C0BDDE2|nr:ABC transporter permease [Clostridium bowmanii]MBU3191177.1 ABC transporter permease [Clostridium bowmanii]MCA1075568.1 ABC transporter permease [Clostridium bowmanii]
MKKFIRQNSRELSIVIAIVIMGLIFGLKEPIYLSGSNIKDILGQSIIYGLMAIGMTAVIIIGGIDLSVGSALALICVIISKVAVSGVNPIICILLALVISVILGLLNGILVANLKLQPFIATLGTMSVFRGVAYLVSDGYPVLGVPTEYRNLINNNIFGVVETSMVMFIIFVIFMYIIMAKTKFGTHIYAIGGNSEAARLSGVRVNKVKVLIYAIAMMGTGIAAMIQVARLGTGDPTTGQGYELNAIAAIAIGGTSMAGGRGTIIGTVLGAILFAGLRNGLIVSNVATFWQYVATGIVIIIAAYIEVIQDNFSKFSRIIKFKVKGNQEVTRL